MEKEKLQEIFCEKISLEYAQFKRKMLKQTSEEIYGKAYKIDCMINIYERLLELSRELGEDVLTKLLTFPSLLAFLYARWMKEEDSFVKELWDSMKDSISQIEEVYNAQGKENAA